MLLALKAGVLLCSHLWLAPLPIRSPEWMAGVQKLVTKCGPRLRVLALEMQVSMIDVAAVVQHIAQQYVGVESGAAQAG